MSKPLGITELVTRIGDKNIRFQNLTHDLSNVAKRKGGTEISFFTDPAHMTPNHAVTGQFPYVGLVLWIRKEDVDRVMAEHDAAPANENGGAK